MQRSIWRVCVGSVAMLIGWLVAWIASASAQIGLADVTVDGGLPVQNEISLTLVPGTVSGQPQVLLAAYNDNPTAGGLGLGVSRSTDGGANWSSAQLPYPTSSLPGVIYNWSFDPTATADTQGNLFAAHIAVDNAVGGANGLYVWRSGDLGQSWLETEVSVAGAAAGFPDFTYRFNDRCQITADRFSTSSYKDNVYISWIKDRGFYNQSTPPPSGLPEGDIYFAYSTDNGANFTSVPTPLNDQGMNRDMGNMPIPRVGADGTVYVSWLDYNVWTGGTGNIYLDTSTDGGVTWGGDQLVSTINLPPLNVSDATGISDALAKGAPVLATSSTQAQELYLVYAANPATPGDEADIFFIKSTNGGVAWSSPLRINTDLTISDQILPWVDVKPDGTIDIAWYDRRNDPGDQLWDIYVTRSIDGGASFLPEFRLNDQPFFTPNNSHGKWMGEYLGLVTDGDYGYVAWTSSVYDLAGDVLFDKFANSSIVPEPSSWILLLGAAATQLLAALLRRRHNSC